MAVFFASKGWALVFERKNYTHSGFKAYMARRMATTSAEMRSRAPSRRPHRCDGRSNHMSYTHYKPTDSLANTELNTKIPRPIAPNRLTNYKNPAPRPNPTPPPHSNTPLHPDQVGAYHAHTHQKSTLANNTIKVGRFRLKTGAGLVPTDYTI